MVSGTRRHVANYGTLKLKSKSVEKSRGPSFVGKRKHGDAAETEQTISVVLSAANLRRMWWSTEEIAAVVSGATVSFRSQVMPTGRERLGNGYMERWVEVLMGGLVTHV